MARNYRDRTAVLTQSDGARWTFTTVEHIPDPTHYILSDVAGWYGGSGVRRTSTARYGHGNFLGPGFREGRTMTLHAGIRCDSADERDWQERNLSGALWDGDTGTLWYDDGQTQLTSPVVLDGAPQIVKSGTRDLVIQVPLVSESPFLYSDWREFTMDPPGVGVGFEFPPFSGGRMTVGENLIGDPESPEVRDLFGGVQWEWNAGGYWTRPAVSGGTTQFNAYPSSSTAHSAMSLIPGAMYVIAFEVWVDTVAPDTAARTAIYYERQDGTTSFVGDATEEGGDTEHWQTGLTAGQWNKITRHWRAPDDVFSGGFAPQLLYGAEDSTEVRIRNPSVHVTEPIITFGTEQVREDHYVWNEGNADAYPQFTVTADSPGGFTVGLVDRLVTYPWATYPDVPVTVDMEGALYVGGRDQTHLLQERNWSKVPPQALDKPVFYFLQGGTGFCTVAHRDTYI